VAEKGSRFEANRRNLRVLRRGVAQTRESNGVTRSHAASGADHHEVAHNRHRIDPLGQQKLEHHVRTVVEANLHGREIIFPHAAELFAGNGDRLRAVRGKPVARMLERVVVVAAKTSESEGV
jgi:hypothetical protein